jgi:hypothetical protein
MMDMWADRPTSEQLRREAEKLRKTAVKFKDQAASLIAKASELDEEGFALEGRKR